MSVSSPTRVSLIAALSENHVIGRAGDLPWRLSRDLKRFKRVTMGHHLLMGRKTFDSIGRPLPGRTSVVISRNRELALPEGVVRAGRFEEALAVARAAGDEEAFVIGGGQIYALALPYGDRLYLTRVLEEVEGDAFFPHVEFGQWQLAFAEDFPPEGKPPYASRYEIWDRRRGSRR